MTINNNYQFELSCFDWWEEKQLKTGANDEFTVKVATTPQEITTLMETGFEYIMTKDDLAYFRKRK